jgi:ubiquinone/menaquinone biosynthesis C-methylase UbiE
MAKAADKFWDGVARKYAVDPIADVAGFERTLAAARVLIEGRAAFEFGCGTGTAALKLAPSAARYVASDISNEMIAIAREKAAAEGGSKAEFVVATADAAPFETGSFDAVLGLNVLHLIEDRAAALAGAHRLLKPGGVLITKTPCLSEMNPLIRLAVPVMQAMGKAPHVAFFNAAELEAEIAAAGFKIVTRERHGSKRKREPRIYLAGRRR